MQLNGLLMVSSPFFVVRPVPSFAGNCVPKHSFTAIELAPFGWASFHPHPDPPPSRGRELNYTLREPTKSSPPLAGGFRGGGKMEIPIRLN